MDHQRLRPSRRYRERAREDPANPNRRQHRQAIPKYRRLWDYIKETLPKRNESEEEAHPLTDYLAEADGPLKQLAGAWEETFTAWEEAGRECPRS